MDHTENEQALNVKKKSIWQTYDPASNETSKALSELPRKTVLLATKKPTVFDVLFWTFAGICFCFVLYWAINAPDNTNSSQSDTASQQTSKQQQALQQAAYSNLKTELAQEHSGSLPTIAQLVASGHSLSVSSTNVQNSLWQSPDGTFQILFPTMPVTSQVNLGTEDAPLQGNVYWTTESATQYFAASFDLSEYYPFLTPDQILNKVVNGIATSMDGTLYPPVLGTWQGYPKINYVINSSSEILEAENILVGEKLYFMGIRSASTTGFTQDDVEKFENSFKLTS